MHSYEPAKMSCEHKLDTPTPGEVVSVDTDSVADHMDFLKETRDMAAIPCHPEDDKSKSDFESLEPG